MMFVFLFTAWILSVYFAMVVIIIEVLKTQHFISLHVFSYALVSAKCILGGCRRS